ncbi:MAG: hypothetical protein JWQ78_1199 [Sediminibacterium sp.]|nr:hypothetical protein [Sediminibacterium sp.]
MMMKMMISDHRPTQGEKNNRIIPHKRYTCSETANAELGQPVQHLLFPG